MKRVSLLFFFFALLFATTAMAYQEVVCQERGSGVALKSYRCPIYPLKAILSDCLSRSDLKLEIVAGKPFRPDEARPVFEDPFTGETFTPDRMFDEAVCYRPGKYYKDFDEYIPRSDLEIFVLWYEGEEREKDLNSAYNECLNRSSNELIGR
ncbi:MAG: hypothetical protein A3F16_04205 [Deltaproteobacteria bacterium RIFCSPHIGHO2_12_FULL_43_9]|nr:MAG: hypothetical protein A3F16_04205 [Deltaproteobacteria bacterium RIFCSPHIGHO2_12_FULL_43_9]